MKKYMDTIDYNENGRMPKKAVKRTTIVMAVLMAATLAGCGHLHSSADISDSVINSAAQAASDARTADSDTHESRIDQDKKNGQSEQNNSDSQANHTEHVYNEVRKDATCTEAGVITYTCKVCGETYSEMDASTPAKGHSYLLTKQAPTCGQSGKNIYTCSVCGDSYTEDDADNPALGHDFSSNTIVVTATEYSPGTRRFSCTRCGESKDIAYGYAHKVKAYNGTQTVYGYWDTACEQEILELLNNYRASQGLKPVSTTRSMIETAHTRAKEIAYSYRHNHSRPTNDRWRTAYPEDDFCGENIASGQADAQEVTTGWIESPDHNENMVNERFRTIGIGVFVRVDCPESGEVTEPDPKGLSHEDSRYYVQAFAN